MVVAHTGEELVAVDAWFSIGIRKVMWKRNMTALHQRNDPQKRNQMIAN
jgi:hypothetical protein